MICTTCPYVWDCTTPRKLVVYAPMGAQRAESRNVIWLSLIRVTDWLNTVTWLKHNSVCSSRALPRAEARAAEEDIDRLYDIDTTKCFHSGKIFHANKWQNELAILSFQRCMLTTLDRALAVYCAHSTIDTHCTARNLKKIPAEKNYCAILCDFQFLQVMQKPGKAMGSHII